jgi:nucleoside 2-deoxyribosyltransferase
MRAIYIAGPYRAKTGDAVRQNIREARLIMAELLRRGYAALCPHTMTEAMEYLHPDIPDQAYLDSDLVLMRRCDAVVLTPGWERSSGTAAEIREAKAAGIPVFETIANMEGHFAQAEGR